MAKNNMYTKQQAIDKIVDDIDNWDAENVVAYAKDCLRENIEKLPLEEIESELNHICGGFDIDNEDDYIKVIDTKASRLLIDGVKK